MNRRQFVKLGVASAFTSVTSAYAVSSFPSKNKNQDNDKGNSVFAAYDDKQGQHFASRFSLDARNINPSNIESMQIPFRAHDTLPLSLHKSLSFGRRPHDQMIVCDFDTQQQDIINAKAGRHFYGHGCVQESSHSLFTTENDYDGVSRKGLDNSSAKSNSKVTGVIGIRDIKTFQQIGEYPSYGVGPHDIKLMPDGKTLVVANGGIATHPDFGRRKLNLKTMQPNLAFIDIDTGKKIDEYRMSNHQLSIRHLSVTADGGIGIATQYQGSMGYGMPDVLLAWYDQAGLKELKTDQQFNRECRGYMGDVAMASDYNILAASSPRGNNISLWDVKQARLIKTMQIPTPCGLCYDSVKQEFLISNDKGDIYTIALNTLENLKNSNQITQQLATQLNAKKSWGFSVKWDNHMIMNA